MNSSSPDRDQLRSYFRCPACGKILIDKEWQLSDPEIPAPCCGATGQPRPVWPDPAVIELLEKALEQDLSRPARLSVAAVYLMAAAEYLLENAVLELLQRRGTSIPSAEATLESHRGIEGLIRIFNELSERPLEALMIANGPADFVKKILLLGPLRRKLYMNGLSSAGAEDREAVEYVRGNCLKAFFTVFSEILSRKGTPPKAVASVLIVDDEIEMLTFIGRIAERKGIRVLKADNGTKGLALFERHRPALTLLDVSLPDKDGLSVLEGIRKLDAQARVYFSTGVGGGAFQKEAERLGAAGYLPKPVDMDVLNALLDSLKE